jgi:hypothetical protein
MCRAIDAAYEVDDVKENARSNRRLGVTTPDRPKIPKQSGMRAKYGSGPSAGGPAACADTKTPMGSRGVGKKVEYPEGTPLWELGISKKQSANWQKLPAAPCPVLPIPQLGLAAPASGNHCDTS